MPRTGSSSTRSTLPVSIIAALVAMAVGLVAVIAMAVMSLTGRPDNTNTSQVLPGGPQQTRFQTGAPTGTPMIVPTAPPATTTAPPTVTNPTVSRTTAATATAPMNVPARIDRDSASQQRNNTQTVTKAMTAYLRPADPVNGRTAWFKGLAPYLTASYAQAMAYTDPRYVEATKLTGPVVVMGDDDSGRTFIAPTDAGKYVVTVDPTGKITNINPPVR